MNVALVCDWYHPRVGGIELHLHDLATHLMRAGHNVVVITPTRGAPVVNGVRVHRVETPLAPHFGFLITRAGVRAIGDALVAEQADVAHCHVSIVSPAALGGALQAQRRGIPTALTFHSVVPQTRALARGAGAALGTSDWRAAFSAVSRRVAADVAPIAGARAIGILPNGIDADFWRTPPRSQRGETVQLVSVMRLNSKKRPLALIKMMRQLPGMLRPGQQVRLRIAGDGPMRPRLERLVQRFGLGDRIEILGRIARDEIRELLSESDIFVLPTVRESFGIAALEARCAGLPVVAMKRSGVAEFIAHGIEGLLAISDRELAAHVAALVSDRDRRDAIASHNRVTAPPFDWPRTIDAHLALYRDAIGLRDSV